MPRAYRWF
ncbi:periplasmic binding s and sugar binding domain of LacI family protein, partial [Vibrio parahaemolyticus V-223/04]